MIHTDFSWTEPCKLILISLALGLLALQCGLLYTRHRHSDRLGIRLVLNGLLWISIVAWILDPLFESSRQSNLAVLVANNVPGNIVARLRDSLRDARMLSVDEVRDVGVDTLVIVGQTFDESIFANIRQARGIANLQWIPWFAPDQVSDLQWKGVVRKGASQRIDGRIQSSQKQSLRISYAGRTLDSLWLSEGDSRFRLTFPAFSEGRTTVELHLGDQLIDTLRFFTQPDKQLTVRFVLDNPDFETRNLATWLGKQGYAVLYDATISKNIRSSLNINRAAAPDLIITTASNAGSPTVKKAVNEGKSVLFVQLSDPVAELSAINNALGTRFQAMKTSNEESVAVSPVLTALSFRFAPRSSQSRTAHYPVAIENTTGKIAVSMLNETFPVQLSGDSVAYGKVWSEILAHVRPAKAPATEWDAPVFKSVPLAIRLNGFRPIPRWFKVGVDTVFTEVSALNERSALATFLPIQQGWSEFDDSLGTELYVQDYSPLRYAAQMQHFIQSTPNHGVKTVAGEALTTARKLPGWVWFAWLMFCLTALWIEPKL